MEIEVGAVVRHRRWGSRFTPTVVCRDAESVFVAWHGSFVEDHLDPDEVEVWPDASAALPPGAVPSEPSTQTPR